VKTLPQLFENNKKWAAQTIRRQPDFFKKLALQQAPDYLWIGCSDSRVPANDIVGLLPGELFVHRNVANLVVHTDMNCLSVLQYAVEVLKVKHVIVCGHYGCGGVKAAIEDEPHGLIDNWLRHIRELYQQHAKEIDSVSSGTDRVNRLCELNVQKQVKNVANTTIVQDAWGGGIPLSVHGWIYSIENGLLRDLGICVSSKAEALDF
jgi:carbonic anhydrase